MIFVTVGNAEQSFARLLNGVAKLAREGVLEDDVKLQIGNSRGVEAPGCDLIDFLTLAEFETAISEADVVVTHAGAGSLIHVLSRGKVPVVMPRQARHGEHIDDHQSELAEAFARAGRIELAREVDDLAGAIERARERGRSDDVAQPEMVSLVDRALDELG